MGGWERPLGIVLVGVLACCGHGGGGYATPEELVGAALGRATAGDIDGLVALSTMSIADSVADCRDNEASDRLKEMKARSRAALEKEIAHWKGATVKVVSARPSGDPDVTRAGTGGSGNCVATVDITHQELEVQILAHTAARPRDEGGTIRVLAIRVRDRWYLEKISGRPPDHLAMLRALRDQVCACQDVACGEHLGARVAAHLLYLEQQKTPPDDEMEKLKSELEACFAKLGLKLNPAP